MTIPDHILIVGLGLSGVAAAKFLHGMGKKVTLADTKDEKALAEPLRALGGIPYKACFGPHRREDFLAHPMIVVSPGVDTEMPLFKEARAAGIRVIGEMELACPFIEAPIIAITGTNGKTTVTTLMGQVFERAFGDVFVGGNIGNPLINYVMEGRKARFVIIEVSSFQLETIETFKPKAALLLNITEDHLDRYRSYDEYITAKYRIFENQGPEDFAILNSDLTPGTGIKAKRFAFSSRPMTGEGAFFSDGTLQVIIGDRAYRYPRDLSPLVGIHNTENLLAVLLTSHLFNIDQGCIEEVVRSFRGLAHRVEFVRELEGVKYFNDSKATNVDAAKRALEGIPGRVILIAGGKDKGGSYGAVAHLMDRVKALVLFGEGRERILRELGGLTSPYVEETLRDAVERARSLAEEGDTVLFSPMCSSFDMFRDYKDRGNQFKAFVGSL